MKLRYSVLVICFLNIVAGAQASEAVATKPPLGWNSYNCYGSAVHENEVRDNADYMAAKLKQYGWQYIVVDFLWSFDNPPPSKVGFPYQSRLPDGSYIPWLSMDEWGRLTPHANKFPLAFGGKGFKPLSDYVHSLGLKFGIHVMRGIPRQAVWAKTPVKGMNGITADMIADETSICDWMNHMYGLNMSKPGAQEYLNSLLELYAEWGVDFIKVDDISRTYSNAEVEGYRKAIEHCGRPIVLSLSPGETPVKQAEHVAKYANMWRLADDFWDKWELLLKMFTYAKNWEGTGSPGHWPDCDMMQIGKLSKRGPVGDERYSLFTEDELYTHMNLWCIFKSPLIIGGNLPENRELELKLFTNEEVLAVNQESENPKELFHDENTIIWASQIPGSADRYVGVFNIGNNPNNISLDFSLLGMKGKAGVRDLWKKKDIGVFDKAHALKLNAHGSTLLRVSPK